MKTILSKTLSLLEEKHGVVWSIFTDTTDKDLDYWIADIGATACCGKNIPDGEYVLSDYALVDAEFPTKDKPFDYEWSFSKTKAVVKHGMFDVESVLKATKEVLKQTKYHGYFVENFAIAGSNELHVHIGS